MQDDALAKTGQCVPSVQGRQGVTLTLPACDSHDQRSISWRVMFPTWLGKA